MRQAIKNGVTIKYPDEIGFSFNTVLIDVDGDGVTRIDVTISTDGQSDQKVSFDAIGGRIYADIRAFVQTLFWQEFTDIDYAAQKGESTTGKLVTVSVEVYNNAGQTAQLDFSTFFVWAALVVGETYNGFRELKYFKGYPFTVDIYSDFGGSAMFRNDAGKETSIDLPNQGIFNLTIPNDGALKYYTLYDYGGTLAETTFDSTFDYTFLKTASPSMSKKARIDIIDGCSDGVYLRWISRHGHINYWLFKRGSDKYTINEGGRFLRNNLLSWDQEYGYRGGATRRQSYTRQDTIPLCAPLVTRETWDFLLDSTASPVLDMFLGYDSNGKPRWQSVIAQAGSYTKEMRTPLQDFALNISLPETPIQSL